jgi:hypothetical protein
MGAGFSRPGRVIEAIVSVFRALALSRLIFKGYLSVHRNKWGRTN